MRSFWRFLAALLLCTALFLALAPFTERGSRSLLALAERFTTLQVDYEGGTIAGTLKLGRIVFNTEGLSVNVTGVLAQWSPACIWRSAVCFRQLQLESFELNLLPAPAQEPAPVPLAEPEQSKELIVFPVWIEAQSLAMESARVVWQGGEWRQGPAQIRLRIRDSSVEIFEAVLTEAKLELRDTGAAPDSDRIELGSIDLPLELSVDELVLERPAWNLYGSEHQLQRMVLRGDWRKTQLRVEELSVEDPERGQLSLQGEMAFEQDWPLQLNSTVRVAEPGVWEGLELRSVEVIAGGNLAGLNVEVTSDGFPEIFAEAALDVLDRQLPFDASIQLTWSEGLRLGDIGGMPDVLADMMMESPLQLFVHGDLQSQYFKLQGAASGLGYTSLELSATGSVQEQQLSVEDLSLREKSGASELRVSSELSFADPLEASFTLSSGGFALPALAGYPSGSLKGGVNANVSLAAGDWQVLLREVQLEGHVNDLPARIDGYAGLGSDLVLGSSDLKAELNGTQLQLSVPAGGGQPGHFELTMEDLERWQVGSRGRIQLEGSFATDASSVKFQGNMQEVHWQDLRIDQGLLSGNFHAKPGQRSQFESTFTEVSVGQIALDMLSLRGEGTPLGHTLTLTSQGELEAALVLTGAYKDDHWNARLAPTTLQTPQGSWRLPEPLAISWAASTARTSVSAHCWLQENTRLCPGELQLGAESRGSVAIDGDLDFLAGLIPPGVELKGDLQARLEGSWDAASGLLVNGESTTRDVWLVRDFGEGEAATLHWDQGSTSVAYNADGLRLNWEARREDRKVVELDIVMPPERDGALAGTGNFRDLQLAALAPLFPGLSTLEGNLAGEFRLSGTLERPLANGILTLSGGQLALVGNPTPLDSLELNMKLLGDMGTLEGSANLGGGKVEINGELSLGEQWAMTLNVSGQQHSILYPPSAQLLVSETLVIKAATGLLDIQGEVVVHEGLLEPEELPPGSVAVSSDVVEVDYAGNVIRQDLPFDLTMDIRFKVEDRFKVTGSLIDATLGGDLRLRQRRQRPLQLFGNLNIISGQFRAYQQSLQIKRGRFNFNGRPDNPSLDVRAQRDISGSNVKVGVKVQGTFEQMTLEVFSDPAMSQGEAMSYLVRGRGLDASSGEDGTALALSLASGVVNRSTIVSELNRIPGVNNIAFGADGTADDTAATVSGYVGSRIFLSYGIGLYEPINVLTARLYLTTRLWLEVVSRLENSVDLYYTFDID